MSAPLPALVGALRAEVAPFLARCDSRRRVLPGFVAARWREREVLVGWTGDGAWSAERGLRALAAAAPIGELVLVGVAGGLTPELAVGQRLAGRRVSDPTGPAPDPDAGLLERLLAIPGIAAGTLYSAPHIVGDRNDKAALGARFEGPAAVDLETATWARTAHALGLRWAALRTISDPAGESLPVDFNRFRDEHGRLRTRQVLGYAVRHPTVVGALRELERRVRHGAEGLADAVEILWS